MSVSRPAPFVFPTSAFPKTKMRVTNHFGAALWAGVAPCNVSTRRPWPNPPTPPPTTTPGTETTAGFRLLWHFSGDDDYPLTGLPKFRKGCPDSFQIGDLLVYLRWWGLHLNCIGLQDSLDISDNRVTGIAPVVYHILEHLRDRTLVKSPQS